MVEREYAGVDGVGGEQGLEHHYSPKVWLGCGSTSEYEARSREALLNIEKISR